MRQPPLEQVAEAYKALLRIRPEDPVRALHLQSVLATLRDILAESSGQSAESVQRIFETLYD